MDQINFSHNWNNKLDCKYFTSIRRSSRYKVGERYEVSLKGRPIKVVRCLAQKMVTMESITPEECWIDTGYSKTETIDILMKMHTDVITTATTFYLMHFETIGNQQDICSSN